MAVPILGPILSIIDKVTNRFNWDRKSIRRNKVKKIERQIDAIRKKPPTDKSSRSLTALRERLRTLKEQAVSD